MARLRRKEALALAGAVAFAITMPAWLLAPAPRSNSSPASQPPLATPAASPPLRSAFARPLFLIAEPQATPSDAPQLVGVVGRLGKDAVALVRGSDGTSRTLAPGESMEGWRLQSLAIDAAYFIRGGQTARVPMPD